MDGVSNILISGKRKSSVSYKVLRLRHAVAWCLRHCATSRKVAGSRPHEVNEFFQFTFRPHYALGVTEPVTEMSTRSGKIMFLESRERPVRRADNLTAICEPIV
jgi:hypothetical protein